MHGSAPDMAGQDKTNPLAIMPEAKVAVKA
ncbi:MAG: hypothetical protein LBS77_01690 [Desulfovibrio sp.]|nr:hypothetical protein [Desulfovibrio sp.]